MDRTCIYLRGFISEHYHLHGRTSTEQECAAVVLQTRINSTGAQWDPNGKYCYAKFGDHIYEDIGIYRDRSCLFQGIM